MQNKLMFHLLLLKKYKPPKLHHGILLDLEIRYFKEVIQYWTNHPDADFYESIRIRAEKELEKCLEEKKRNADKILRAV